MGYLSPFGDDDEGSEIFLSTIDCLPINGIVGFDVLIAWLIVAPVATFIFCMERD